MDYWLLLTKYWRSGRCRLDEPDTPIKGKLQYDHLNRLRKISNVPTGTGAATWSYEYQYDNLNRRIRTTLADGSYWVYQYDAMGQVISGRRFWADHTPVAGQQYDYAFDDIGNRMGSTGTKVGGDQTGGNQRSASYTRNLLNQYTQRTVPDAIDVLGVATASSAVTVNSQSTYRKGEYFWKQLSVANSSTPVAQSVTVAVSGVSSVVGNVLVPPATQTFLYDADGNLTNDTVWVYKWDAENRLIQMTNTWGVTSGARKKLLFEYDHVGRRIRKQVYNWATTDYNGTATNDFKHIYDGWNLVLELTNSVPRNSYLWGTDLSGSAQGAGGVGGLLMVARHDADVDEAVDEWYFVGYDGNGNVAGLVNGANGAWSANYEYGPFGELIRITGASSGLISRVNPYRFSTKYQDNETELLYYGYRHLNPSTGRWLNRDLIEEKGGSNLNGFVQNRPLNSVDHLGLITIGFAGFDTWWPGINDGNSNLDRINSLIIDSERLFESASVSEAFNHLLKKLDTNGDGKYGEGDHKEAIRIYGWSWGGASAVLLAKKIRNSDKFCHKLIGVLATIDPVTTFRRKPAVPNNVLLFYNRYQTKGDGYNGEPYTFEPGVIADQVDMNPTGLVKTKRLMPAQEIDHINILYEVELELLGLLGKKPDPF